MTLAVWDRPVATIALDGATLPRELAALVSLVLVRSALGAPSVAEVDFVDPEGAAGEILRLGAELTISIGGEIFAGKVAAIDRDWSAGSPGITRLRAYDALENLRHKSQIRQIVGTSAEVVAADLAGAVGLSSRADHSAAKLESAVQAGETDFAFLSRLAGREGLYPIVEAGALRLADLSGQESEIELTFGETLLEARVTQSAERLLQGADIHGWSPTTHARHKTIAFGAEDATSDLGPQVRALTNRPVESDDESLALGQADLDRGAATLKVAEGVAIGDAAIRPGRPIKLIGGPGIEGRYVVTSTVHKLDVAGYRTEFSTRPPEPRAEDDAPVVTLGAVTSIADPELHGRCKVRLPGYDGIEVGWLQTMVAAAGDRKGVTALPEVNDDVLVIFPTGDLAHGFVLGGLYGTKRLPPGLNVTSTRPFVIRSAAGQTLELSGKGSTARLSNNSGSLLELLHDKTRLAAASDLIIEAPGKRITIRAAEVDFEKG